MFFLWILLSFPCVLFVYDISTTQNPDSPRLTDICPLVILPPEVKLLAMANYVGRGLHFRDAIRPTKATQVINTHKPQIPRISTPLLDNSPSPPIQTTTPYTQISQTNPPNSPLTLPQTHTHSPPHRISKKHKNT